MIVAKLHPMRRATGILLSMLLCMLAVLFLDACRPQLPDGVIGEGKMERILYDYHMAQGIAESTPPDSGNLETYRYELISAVFRKHGITEEQFEQSMTYYCSDLQRLHKIYKNLERRYEREANAFGQTTTVRDVYANLSADGDTANVWGGQPILVVRSTVQENLQTWQQTCDSTWLPGDQLIWRLMPVSFSSRNIRSITADLIVHYTNDSVRGGVRNGSTGSQMEVRIANPEGWTPASIVGHLYMPVGNDEQDMAVIAATQLMLIRLHVEQKIKPEILKTDSTATDSLSTDSMDATSSRTHENDRRLSPDEFRRQQPVDQKLDIVKEKPYIQPRQQQNRRRLQQPHLVPQRKPVKR